MTRMQELIDYLEQSRQAQLQRALEAPAPVRWNEVAATVDRVMLPSLLFRLLTEQKLDMDTLPDAISAAWVSPEFPTSGGQHMLDAWELIFHRALRDYPDGFVVSDDGIVQHPEIPPLYRGAAHEHRLGMSWTSDFDKAKWFADRFGEYRKGNLYTINPDAVRPIGMFLRRGESEWVIEQPASSDVTLCNAM